MTVRLSLIQIQTFLFWKKAEKYLKKEHSCPILWLTLICRVKLIIYCAWG